MHRRQPNAQAAVREQPTRGAKAKATAPKPDKQIEATEKQKEKRNFKSSVCLFLFKTCARFLSRAPMPKALLRSSAGSSCGAALAYPCLYPSKLLGGLGPGFVFHARVCDDVNYAVGKATLQKQT